MAVFQRTHPPEPGVVLFIMPFGEKGGFSFDRLYEEMLRPTVERLGLAAERVDSLYGPQGMLDLVWRAIQRAEIVIVDFSNRSVNVGFELALAMVLGKRYVIITQAEDDIPTDLRGLNRHLLYSESYFDMHKLERELASQLEALRKEPAEEMALIPFAGYGATKVPATVIAVEKEYATVRTENGRFGHVTGANVDYTRVYADLTKRFKVGDLVEGAFAVDIRTQEPRYTLLVGEENPWTQIAATMHLGTTFTGTVTAVTETAGAFVRVLGRINGLVPRSAFAAGLPKVGEHLEVVVSRLDIEGRRITLQLSNVARAAESTGPVAAPVQIALPSEGARFDGTVVRVVPENNGRGGYMLLDLPGFGRPGMLLAKHMTDDLRIDLGNGQVELGEEIAVEVLNVEPSSAKILLRDLTEADIEAEPSMPVGSLG